MSETFKFSPRQRAEIVKELGTSLGINCLEDMVEEYRAACMSRPSLAEVRDRLRDVRKYSRSLRRLIQILAKDGQVPADWILGPLIECESYADRVLKYRFARPLKRGRKHHRAEVELAQGMAALWDNIHGCLPGKGRGPFSRLVGKVLRYAAVPGGRTTYPEELVAEVIPHRTVLRSWDGEYPFIPISEKGPIPPLKRAADTFFQKALAAAEPPPKIYAFVPRKGGDNHQKT